MPATCRGDLNGHPVANDRLFVAVWPDDSVRDLLAALPRPAEDGVRWSRPDHWHVTLRFIGEADAGEAERRLRGRSFAPATLRLGPTVRRLGSRLIVVPVAGADRLAADVRAATDGIGEPPDRRFRGHLTLGRTQRGARSRLVGTPFEATMTVTEIALVESELSSHGATYRTIATVPTVTAAST